MNIETLFSSISKDDIIDADFIMEDNNFVMMQISVACMLYLIKQCRTGQLDSKPELKKLVEEYQACMEENGVLFNAQVINAIKSHFKK